MSANPTQADGMKATPGPWETDGHKCQRYVDDSGRIMEAGAIGIFAGEGVACVALAIPGCLPASGNEDAAKANARLIAACPDLYEALDGLADLFKDLAGDQSTETGWKNEELLAVYQRARAALSKAGAA